MFKQLKVGWRFERQLEMGRGYKKMKLSNNIQTVAKFRRGKLVDV